MGDGSRHRVVDRVLVVGAGTAGCAATILLARAGVAVDLLELRSGPTAGGSGITLQGNALRVLRELGLWDAARDLGYAFDGVGVLAPDGSMVVDMPDLRTGGDDLPATLGIARPELARLMIAQVRACGVEPRFSTSVVEMGTDGLVTTSEGETERYDLVVAADGARSRVRGLAGVDTEIEPADLGIWRVFTTRPPEVVRTDLTYGGPAHIAGYCPTGPDSLYAYLVEDVQDHTGLSPVGALDAVRALAAGYGGAWEAIRARMTDPRGVHYSRFESHVVPAPWYRDRVVLVGDAAHSCPPTLAQGAAQALEDAQVLVDELVHRDHADLTTALEAYTARRLPRARAVVEASVQIVRWLADREPPAPAGQADVPGLIARIADELAVPP